MAARLSAVMGPAVAGMLSLLIIGCGKQATRVPDTAPFHYHGRTLFFPKGTVEVRDQSSKTDAYARLMPDKPRSGYAVDARYIIVLGTGYTGKEMGGGYWLGHNQYPPDSLRSELADKYVMFCPPQSRQVPAFNCAALLRSLPSAAIQFNELPSPEAARSMIADAENYLTRAKAQKAKD